MSMDKGIEEQKKYLVGRYRKEYDILENYIKFCDRKYDKKGECMEEILDLLLSAQQNTIDVDEVIGQNRGAFCENLLASKNVLSPADRVKESLVNVCVVTICMILFYAVLYKQGDKNEIFVVDGKIKVLYPFGISIIQFIVDYSLQWFTRMQIAKNGRCFITKCYTLVQLFVMVLCCLGLYELERLLKIDFSLSVLKTVMIFSLFLIVVEVIVFITKKKNDDKNNVVKIKMNEKDDESIKFDFKIHKGVIYKKELIKKYIQRKKKCEEQGIFYTMEDFIYSQRKKIDFDNRNESILLIALGVIEILLSYIMIMGQYNDQIKKTEIMFMFSFVLLGIMLDMTGIVINQMQLKVIKELEVLSSDEILEEVKNTEADKNIFKKLKKDEKSDNY